MVRMDNRLHAACDIFSYTGSIHRRLCLLQINLALVDRRSRSDLVYTKWNTCNARWVRERNRREGEKKKRRKERKQRTKRREKWKEGGERGKKKSIIHYITLAKRFPPMLHLRTCIYTYLHRIHTYAYVQNVHWTSYSLYRISFEWSRTWIRI